MTDAVFRSIGGVRVLLGIGLLAVGCAAPQPPVQAFGWDDEPVHTEWHGHLSYAVGYRRLNADWEPARDQWLYGGLDFDLKHESWPLSFVGQALFSREDDAPGFAGPDGDWTDLYEVNIGLRKVFEWGHVHPYVGGGMGVVNAAIDERAFEGNRSELDEDRDLGAWAGVGFSFPTSRRSHFAIQWQMSWGAELELFGQTVQTDSWSLMFLWGLRQ